MRDMSRAIRHELQEHGPTLSEIPDDALAEYTQIVGAFWLDLKDEAERRAMRLRRTAKEIKKEGA
jgi:hypothetical protein